MGKDIINMIDKNRKISYEQSFSVSMECTKLLANGKEQDEAKVRQAVIHILDAWERIPKETYAIWNDIIEAIGFYPYLESKKIYIEEKSLSDEIRISSFRSDNLEKTFMHKQQKQLSNLLMQEKNVIASAPTSFGKSLLIEEIVASQIYKNIVIIQPTLALLDETRLKLKKYNRQYKIIVRTSQIPSEDKGNLFLLTAERVMEYDNLPHIDLLIIDEFYKLSLRRIDERADVLNNAFLKIINNYNSKFYFLGPNIDGITEGFSKRYNTVFFKSQFSLVDCNIEDVSGKFDNTKSQRSLDKDKLPVLFDLLDKLGNEQTLIYCSTPARARRFAKAYYEHLIENTCQSIKEVPLVEWIEQNISPNWSLAKELRYGIAIHDGSLQKHIGASIIKYFNEGRLRYIFCTSTIIEGVNTSAKNVILYDGKKGGKEIDFFDYSNIKGRSGRMMEHYVGRVYNFVPIPKEESIIIDIPFYEQDREILTDEILVNINQKDVKRQVLDRYNRLYEIKPELLKIIKRNGTNVNGQMNIYYALERDVLTYKYDYIAWSQIPNWDKLNYVLEIAENNTFDFESKHGVFSVSQLVRYIDMYRKNKNIMQIVRDIYEWKAKKIQKMDNNQKERYLDDAIETAFHIYRHWFQFTVPKTFRVVDSLQRYVCEKHSRKAGSYSYFVQQLENDFLEENLSILIEYGIPNDTIRRIAKYIPKDLEEDDVIIYIKKNINRISSGLLQYEIDRLRQCL
ncbi:DEAD/DEAH box helicase [bacterium 1XD42-8]|nr:DEAD/DEAH box helicase [bacterium 1XD42-8]